MGHISLNSRKTQYGHLGNIWVQKMLYVFTYKHAVIKKNKKKTEKCITSAFFTCGI